MFRICSCLRMESLVPSVQTDCLYGNCSCPRVPAAVSRRSRRGLESVWELWFYECGALRPKSERPRVLLGVVVVAGGRPSPAALRGGLVPNPVPEAPEGAVRATPAAGSLGCGAGGLARFGPESAVPV